MQYKIRVFGIIREIAGTPDIQLEFENDPSASEILNQVKVRYPELNELVRVVIAVNNEYVQDDHRISSTDEIAIIPPVSGG